MITKDLIEKALDYPGLISRLRDAFGSDAMITPQRHHHDIKNPGMAPSTLLLMPSWQEGKNLGIKIVTVSPHNAARNMPSIHGLYLLFDLDTGDCKHIMDARPLTVKRTAATSALASSFLSRPESKTLLMVGTGALSPELIKAHAAVRPINKVWVWGRHTSKAEAICKQFRDSPFTIAPATKLDEVIGSADIISTATLSETPILPGKMLAPGQHLDLVGSYRPVTREVDDDCIRRSSVFVDTRAGALKESGDMAIPLATGVLTLDRVKAELRDLCRGDHKGRTSKEEITLFKSVGHAMEDLVAATMVAESLDVALRGHT